MDASKDDLSSEIIDRLVRLEENHTILVERVKTLESEKLNSFELTAMLRELILKSQYLVADWRICHVY